MTAAARGNSPAVVVCLTEESTGVVVSSFREESTASTADAAKATKREALSIQADIATLDAIGRTVQQGLDTCGTIGIIVNNVGSALPSPRKVRSGSTAKTEVDWDGTYEQNLRASVLRHEAVAPHFVEQKSGTIVNVASIAGRMTPSEKSIIRFVPPSFCAIYIVTRRSWLNGCVRAMST